MHSAKIVGDKALGLTQRDLREIRQELFRYAMGRLRLKKKDAKQSVNHAIRTLTAPE